MPDDLAVVALPEAEMLKQAIPQASEADIQALDALDPDARRQRLGNSLYPGVVGLVGDGLASKVTGMLVDQPTAEVLAFISSQEALTIAVYKAVDALPPDVIDALVLEEAGGSLDGSSLNPAAMAAEPSLQDEAAPGSNGAGRAEGTGCESAVAAETAKRAVEGALEAATPAAEAAPAPAAETLAAETPAPTEQTIAAAQEDATAAAVDDKPPLAPAAAAEAAPSSERPLAAHLGPSGSAAGGEQGGGAYPARLVAAIEAQLAEKERSEAAALRRAEAAERELSVAREQLGELQSRYTATHSLVMELQQRDGLAQAALSKQISNHRINQDTVFAALRERVATVERDLEDVYKEVDDEGAVAERENARDLISQAGGASENLSALTKKLNERLKIVKAAEQAHEAAHHRIASKALVGLAKSIREILESKAAARMPAHARLQEFEMHAHRWLTYVRGKAIEAGLDAGPDATRITAPAAAQPETEEPLPSGRGKGEGAGQAGKGGGRGGGGGGREAEPARGGKGGKGEGGKGGKGGKGQPAAAEGGKGQASPGQQQRQAKGGGGGGGGGGDAPSPPTSARNSNTATPRGRADAGQATTRSPREQPAAKDGGGATTVEVVLHKENKDTRIGVTLTGTHRPVVSEVADPPALAAGTLFAGDAIQSINGWNAVGHSEATKRMKRLTGELRLTIIRHSVERNTRTR